MRKSFLETMMRPVRAMLAILTLAGSVAALSAAVPITLVPTGAIWRYLDDGSNQGTNWITSSFNDTSWSSGPAELGYGDGDEATRVEDNATPGYNLADTDRYITTYFRHRFVITNAQDIISLHVQLLRDDGAVVYLNGREG